MSVFKAIDTLNPYGKSDKVLNINLDSQSDAYSLNSLIYEAGTYVFSVWVKADSNSTVNFKILGTDVSFQATGSWNLFQKRIDADGSNKLIEINPQININTYFYEGFLSKGTTFTGWAPAPEDVDADISNAQNTADSAQTNANTAMQNAGAAQNTANGALEKADQAKTDAAAASSAAQKAKDQADAAQTASNEANRLASTAYSAISPIAQVTTIDSEGLKVANSKEKTSYAQVQSAGVFVFTNKQQRAVFGADSKMENLAVQDYLMFGSHRAETEIEDGEEGTAFFHIGDVN